MVIINKVILIGRLTKNPDLTYTPGNGTAVAKFGLAVTRPFKKDETDFINCVAFGKTAETITQYLVKGNPIAVTGRIQTGSYDAKDGTKRYTTDVIIESFEFVAAGKKDDNKGTHENEFDTMSSTFGAGTTEEATDYGDMPFNSGV